MKKETRGGKRPGSGRKASGRERGNFTTTLGAGTIEFLQSIHPKAGQLIDLLVSEYRLKTDE
jgi:hypothetical protein